jgi:GNAT superfamily N-acetyltransferase
MHAVAPLAETIEAEAFAQLLRALPADLEARIGARVMRRGSAVSLITPGADDATVNQTIALGFDNELDDATLSAVCADYVSAGVPRWLVHWSPEASRRDERDLFARHGGQPKTPVARMWGSLDDARATASRHALRVEEIGREFAEAFQRIVAPSLGLLDSIAPLASSAIGHDQWHHYLVFDGDTPIAGAAMFTLDRGAWFGMAATLPEARGHGAQKLLLARRMLDARKLGCEWVTAGTAPDTESHPNPSYRNMLRAGMRLLYLQPKYLFGRPPTM